MQCPSCHAELQPGVDTCPHCGAPVHHPTPLTNDDPYGDEVPYVEHVPTAEETVTIPEAVVPGEQQEIDTPLETEKPSSPVIQASPVQPTAPSVPRTALSRLSKTERMLATLCLLLLLIGLIGSALYRAVFYPLEMNAQATAIAHAMATAQVQGPTLTATANQQLYALDTKSTPTLSDSLSSAENSRLFVADTATPPHCVFTKGAYHVQTTEKGQAAFCTSSAPLPENFVYQVEMTFTHSSTKTVGGLFFHFVASATGGQQITSFLIQRNGSYMLSTNGTLAPQQIFAHGTSSAIHTDPGQVNTLTIITQGSQIYAYINKQFVAQATDPSLSAGGIGFQGGDPDDLLDNAFQNLQIWQLS